MMTIAVGLLEVGDEFELTDGTRIGMTWAEEGLENAIPADPELRDLPPLRPGWGSDS